ncbi:hypothetical protein HBI81_020410 [Parastagonospora nodorum]|nr:hypothetical protein HBH52_166430 [Parastagonospora nodorum]KAH5016912.1 hypothetical protein HBI74_169290 [Parastagonospora nodorum]KAH6544520.1 hypothetical protein HBI81_020410 [Parastagonospora nodorum]
MAAASDRSSTSPSPEHNTEESRVERPKQVSHFEKEKTRWIPKPPPPTFSQGSDQNTNNEVDKHTKGPNEPGDSRTPDGNDDEEKNEETGYGQASVPVQVKMTLHDSQAIAETWKDGTMSMKQEFPPEGHYCLVRLLNESCWSWYPQADVRERS